MWFRLAQMLGGTVAELQERMSSREFAEWCAFYQLDPFGEARSDLRTGFLASMLYNIHRRKGARRSKPIEWLISVLDQPRKKNQATTDKEMETLLRGIAKRFGKVVTRDGVNRDHRNRGNGGDAGAQ